MQSTLEPRANPADAAQEVALAALVERAIDGMHRLATEEASLTLEELESDARALRRAAALAGGAGLCATASLTWAGVALSLSLGSSTAALTTLAGLGVVLASAAAFGALQLAPRALLGASRARVQARFLRLRESLR